MTVLQAAVLHRRLGSIDLAATAGAVMRILVASALLAGVSYGVWYELDALLGTSLVAQIVSVGVALAAGAAVYTGAVLAMRVAEARQIVDLLRQRLRRSPS
jgi:putative peptidoglycan lipid II flippase